MKLGIIDPTAKMILMSALTYLLFIPLGKGNAGVGTELLSS
jgi:hypothetical protein